MKELTFKLPAAVTTVLREAQADWEVKMSRKKSLMQQAIPNDPIQQAKQKMLERAANRRKLQPAPPAPKPSPTPTSLKERQDQEVWAEVERVARTLVGDAAVDAEYLKEEAPAQAETWQKKTPSRERVEAKVEKLEQEYWAETEDQVREMVEGMKPYPIPPGYTPSFIPSTSTKLPEWMPPSAGSTSTIPIPDHPPFVLLRADRPSTPKDALGPEPGIVRQILLGTAEWPQRISILKSSLAHYDERIVRYHRGQAALYFWLANGTAIYDVEEVEMAAGTKLKGMLLRGTVFPLIPTPKE